MQPPLLSVVMPVHGGGDWLAAALESLPDAPGSLEVIIRDSTPGGPCPELIETHAGRFDIDYRFCPETPSWTRKTNEGVRAARAAHVCTLHQDDLWLPGRLESFLALRAAHPDACLMVSPSRIVDAAGRTMGVWRMPLRGGPVDPTHMREVLLVQNSIAIPAPVFRGDAFLAVGGLDESLWYTPDWDLWLKLAAHGPVVYDPHPRTAFRIHPQSQTMTGDRDEFAQQLDTVLDRYISPDSRHAIMCRTSARINVLLARAARGDAGALFKSAACLMKLGPVNAVRYLHLSRLVDRVLPRLRAGLARHAA